jgi:hypothetical protein
MKLKNGKRAVSRVTVKIKNTPQAGTKTARKIYGLKKICDIE